MLGFKHATTLLSFTARLCHPTQRQTKWHFGCGEPSRVEFDKLWSPQRRDAAFICCCILRLSLHPEEQGSVNKPWEVSCLPGCFSYLLSSPGTDVRNVKKPDNTAGQDTARGYQGRLLSLRAPVTRPRPAILPHKSVFSPNTLRLL